MFFFAAFVFQMVFLIITAYVMTPVGAVTCITIAVGVGGFAWAGFSVNHLDIAPQVLLFRSDCKDDQTIDVTNWAMIKATVFLFVGLHFILKNFKVRRSGKK